jgi:hypothetical protein
VDPGGIYFVEHSGSFLPSYRPLEGGLGLTRPLEGAWGERLRGGFAHDPST